MNKCKKINLVQENLSSFWLAFSDAGAQQKLSNKNIVALTRHHRNGSDQLDKHGSVRNLTQSWSECDEESTEYCDLNYHPVSNLFNKQTVFDYQYLNKCENECDRVHTHRHVVMFTFTSNKHLSAANFMHIHPAEHRLAKVRHIQHVCR